jgi:flavin-dependent dehydrogenase
VERFDVAVIGAGPAGSTAAYRLARARARVIRVANAR